MVRGKPAKKYSQAARLHDVIRLIEARHGISIEELVEETGVTSRTIHRDLNAIHQAGYPLVSDKLGKERSYRFLTRFRDVPPINFTLQELSTLYFLRGQAEIFNGTPFEDEVGAIFRKVRSVLPPRYAAHMERIAGVALPLIQGRHDYRTFAEPLLRVRNALVHQHRLTLSYLPSGKKRAASYLVDPYTLVFYKGGLYLIGYAHKRQALRTFAIERIRGVVEEKDRFELPADYRPSERLRDAFGIVAEEPMEVKVRFSPLVAHAVSGRLWHPTQKLDEMADGSVELAFSAGGRLEIVSWILSYGGYAEVLSPAELRAQVKEAVRRMGNLYGTEVSEA